MNKNTTILVLVGVGLLIFTGAVYALVGQRNSDDIVYAPEETGTPVDTVQTDTGDQRRPGMPVPDAPTAGKLKADVFTGTLETVDTGCFADGECFVEVDGKHVTAIMGWTQETVGTIQGVPSFGDLESHIGSLVEVYAQDKSDGTYTLYGSEGFYIKVLDAASTSLKAEATLDLAE